MSNQAIQPRVNLFFRGNFSPISRFIIREESMLPGYQPGDHVLTFNWGKITAGNIVVFRSPFYHFIKRVDKYVDNYVYVSGDNRKESAKFEPLKFSDIIGKVILKY